MNTKLSKLLQQTGFFIWLIIAGTIVADAQYTLTDDDVEVVEGIIQSCSYDFSETDIIIPETLDGQTVTGIKSSSGTTSGVFFNKGITSLVLPASITFIGEWAFNRNSLTSLNLSNCTALNYILYGAFRENSLTSLDLTGCTALTYIEAYAFGANSSLSSFALPASSSYADFSGWKDGNTNEYSAGDNVNLFNTFYYAVIPYTLTDDDVVVRDGTIESCSYNVLFNVLIIPETLDGQTVTGISDGYQWNDGVFYNKYLTEVTLPATLSYIGQSTFRDNKLINVNLDECENLQYIGSTAFYENNISSIDLSNCSELNYIGINAFTYNSALSYFVLPTASSYPNFEGWMDGNNVEYSAGDTITDFTTAYYAVIPYTLTDSDVVVEDGIIQSCSNEIISNVIVIPEMLDGQAVTGISSSVFSERNITSLTLPATLTSIGSYAFYSNSISYLDLSACTALSTIGSSAFYSNSLTNLDFSHCAALTTIESSAFCYNRLTSIDLSNCSALAYIGERAFLYSPGGIILPASSSYANFQGWKDGNNTNYSLNETLTNKTTSYYAVVPYTLTDDDVVVNNGMIDSCNYSFLFKTIIIPETLDGQTVTGVNNSTFFGKDIASVTLPATLTTIGRSAFMNNSLTSVDLSACNALTSIGQNAFYSNNIVNLDLSACTSLTDIGNAAFIGNSISSLNLSGCTALTTIESSAFANNSIASIDLSNCNALTYIGGGAFRRNNLETINLINCTALTYIGEGAFNDNSDLTSLMLPTPDYSGFQGWKDGNQNEFSAGEEVTDFQTHYYALVPYTLTDDDVVVNNGIIESCSYSFLFKTIIIPETLDGQTVTGIADKETNDGVFEGNSISEITLPSTLNYIGNHAFTSNSLAALDLSGCSALTSIGNYAFQSNDISSLNLSASSALTTIGTSAFSSNSLENLDLSACTALTVIGNSAFQSNSLKSLDFSACTALTSIRAGAFDRNSLNSINLGNSTALTFIGKGAFNNNADLIPFSLPISDYAGFMGWKDGNQNAFAAGEEVTNFQTQYYAVIPYILTDADVIVNNGIIDSCSYNFLYKTIIIPATLDGQTVTGIADKESGNGVFAYEDICEITLPATLSYIGDRAFSSNSITSLLSSFTALDSIGDYAFYGNSLDSLDLSNCTSLISIGASAFYNNSLKDLELNNCSSLTSIGYFSFGNNSLENLDLSGCTSLTTIGDYAFYYNPLDSLDLSACTSLTYIGSRAFYHYNSTQLTLPDTQILGYDFRWLDEENTEYAAGATVYDLLTSYSANLTRMYDIVFTISDGTDAIANATVSLTGYGTTTSDASGVAAFTNVSPEENLAYTITALNYDDATGTVTFVDDIVFEEVTLDLTTYAVKFTIADPEDNGIANATISLDGYGTETSNASGIATFTGIVPPASDLAYTISAVGYNDANGKVSILDADVNIVVKLSPNTTDITERGNYAIKVFPNPVSAVLTVTLPTNEEITSIEVYNSKGQKTAVYVSENNQEYIKLPVQSFKQGTYILKINTLNRGSYTHTFVKD